MDIANFHALRCFADVSSGRVPFFEQGQGPAAYWLKDTIPGARRVVEVKDARLFFPENRPDSLATPVLEFWTELSST